MEPLNDHDLIVRMDERLKDVHEIVKGSPGRPGLSDRVDSLESDRDKIKGITYIGGGGGLLGLISAVYHFFSRGH